MTTLADLERVERELRQSALEARSTADLVHAMPATADFWADTIAAYIAEQRARDLVANLSAELSRVTQKGHANG